MPTQALELVQAGYPVRADRLAPILVDLAMRDVDVPAIRDEVPLEMMKKLTGFAPDGCRRARAAGG
jgi:hypothetical protein